MKQGLLFIVSLAFASCVDRIDTKESLSSSEIIVVDGLLTDQEGPYKVRLFQSSKADAILNNAIPLVAKQVTIISSAGEIEALVSTERGEYETKPDGIRGVVGRSYSLRIELFDGTIIESATPQKIIPVAEVDSLYFAWETFKPLKGKTEYGFRVFLDTKQIDRENGYLRWRYTGIYMAEALPQLRGRNDNCQAVPDPPPCSGLGWTVKGLERLEECSCCICWVSDSESKPQLNDKLSTDGTFKKVEIGFVPFNQWTFRFRKYMIRVEQMSLSDEAFEFWRIIRDQKEGITNLFQPAFGKLKSNMVASNDTKVTGIFYASAIKSKVSFVTAKDAKIPVPELDIAEPCFLAKECDKAYQNASRTPPLGWE